MHARVMLGLTTALLFVLAGGLTAQAATISIPEYKARPGTLVEVPLQIDSAAGIAGAHAKINFDRNLVDLLGVQRGSLGGQFDLVWAQDDGVLDIFLARGDALVAGGGALAWITFRVNPGARPGHATPLVLADYNLTDDSGVVALNRLRLVAGASGRVTVTDSTVVDNRGNGLPDEWEVAKGLDPKADNALEDPDEDGYNNTLEYFHALHPGQPNPVTPMVHEAGPHDLRFEFRRGRNIPDLAYTYEWSEDLTQWHLADSEHVFTEEVIGGDGEYDLVRASCDLPENTSRLYARIRINRR